MVRDVLVKVRHHKQQVQHSFSLAGVGFAHFLFEVRDDGERIREQPLEVSRGQWEAFAAAAERVVCANKRLVEEMVQAKLLAGEGVRYGLLAGGSSAASQVRCVHDTPQNLGVRHSRGK